MIFVPHTRVHLTNLTSYTSYLVTLTAFNTAGDGPPSDPRGARTLPSGGEYSLTFFSSVSKSDVHLIRCSLCDPPAPSQPSYLDFSELTGTSVNVSWGAPVTPNGQVEGYRVVYQPTVPLQGGFILLLFFFITTN